MQISLSHAGTLLPEDTVPLMLPVFSQALAFFFPQVHIGVKGFVRDAITGAGLDNATIAVAGIAHNITAGKFGDFHRLLVPGTYNVTAFVLG